MAMTSLMPPGPVRFTETMSTFQPCRSAKREYMRKTSFANSAASSPPVPARISSSTFFSSFGSFGTSSSGMPASSSSRRASSARSSSCAISRSSASVSARAISWTLVISWSVSLYARKRSTMGAISLDSRASFW